MTFYDLLDIYNSLGVPTDSSHTHTFPMQKIFKPISVECMTFICPFFRSGLAYLDPKTSTNFKIPLHSTVGLQPPW